MILKVFLTLEVDEDDYQVPVDRLVDSEVSAALEEYIYDIDGLTVQTIKKLPVSKLVVWVDGKIDTRL